MSICLLPSRCYNYLCSIACTCLATYVTAAVPFDYMYITHVQALYTSSKYKAINIILIAEDYCCSTMHWPGFV